MEVKPYPREWRSANVWSEWQAVAGDYWKTLQNYGPIDAH
jgi:hypothetical protein